MRLQLRGNTFSCPLLPHWSPVSASLGKCGVLNSSQHLTVTKVWAVAVPTGHVGRLLVGGGHNQ